jgi:nitrite reductase/ring-hydroxylating ferredoxin subunit
VAFDDRCTHRGGSLAGGAMICETVQCPWHGSQFNVETGAVMAGPAEAQIQVYQIEEREDRVYIQFKQSEPTR